MYAELIWSGSHGYCNASATVLAQANNPIVFITPAGSQSVAAALPTAKNDASHYVRSADVTALVRAGGPGTYLAGSIPSTICAGEDNSNAAGWTLAVVYHEGSLPTRNLTLFVGLEPHNGAAASVAGFCTPGTGTLAGRLAVTAAEGDASSSGPTMRFGLTPVLPDTTRLKGPNNPLTNFFSSQINGDAGTRVTTGSFGNANHSASPSANVSGGRQGWDITNVSVSAQLVPNQSIGYARGTSTGEAYRILGIGLQIDVLAPAFQADDVLTVDRPVARVGNVLTYTALVRNTVSGGITADNILFTRALAPGTSFVPNSVTVDGVPFPGANPDIGVPLGSIAGGAQRTVTYQLQVDSIPTPPVIRGDVSWTYTYVACSAPIAGSFLAHADVSITKHVDNAAPNVGATVQTGGGGATFVNTASIVPDPANPVDLQPGDNTASAVVTAVPVADIAVAVSSPGIASLGEDVTWTVRVDNLGPSAATGVRTLVTLPPGLLLQTATPAIGTFNPSTGEWLIPTLNLGQTVSLSLVTQVTQGGQIVLEASRITSAPVDPVTANNQAAAALEAIATADIQVQLSTDDDTPAIGQTVQLTLRVRNAGPARASGLVVTLPIPAGLAVTQATAGAGAYNAGSGVWTIGVLPVGSEITLTVLAQVATSSPITVLAQSSALDQTDPIAANNQAGVALHSVAADVQVVKTSDQADLTEGARLRFRIVVTNNGPVPATNVVVNDPLPAGLLYISHVASQGSYDPSTGAWTVGSLAASGDAAFATLDLTTVVRGTGSVSNVATLASMSEVDLIAANNVDQRGVRAHIWSTFLADLVLDANVTPGVAIPGGLLTYSLVAVNRGPTYVIDEAISGQLPNHTTFVSLTPSTDGSCTAPALGNAGSFSCTWLGNTLLEEGVQRSATLVVRVDTAVAAGSIITGRFTVASATPDYYPPSNTDIVSVSVRFGSVTADLAVSGLLLSEGIIGSALAVPIGIPTPVRFTVTNSVFAAVSSARYLIEIPSIDFPGMQVLGATLSQGSAAIVGVSSAEWTLGPLGPGASATFDLTLVLQTMRSTTIAMRRLGSTPPDANAGNDRAEVVLDGVGASAGGERSIAVGNIDGTGGSEIVIGAGRGETPLIRVYSSTGADTGTMFLAYNRAFEGGVRVTTCDVDADGVDEIITAPGPGPGPHVRVMSVRGQVVDELVGFYALDPSYPFGLYPACADVDGDGLDDVILGAGEGGTPQVLAFSVGRHRVRPIASFLAYEPGFIGGVRVAAVKDGQPAATQFRIVTTPGPGRPLDVRTWQRQGASATMVQALPLTGPEYQLGGFPQVGDLNSDGRLDVVIGAGAGAPPLVDALTISTGQFLGVAQVFPAGFLGGVRLAVGDLENDGRPEVLVAPGLGGRPIVDVYSVSGAGATFRFRLTPIEVP